MAQIDVFPLSVNGVMPPMNLISNALAGKGITSNYLYPLDLGSNSNYGHAVIFSAVKPQYTSSISGALSNIMNLINPQTLLNLNGQFNPQGSISLYMPDTLAVNYSHNYGEVSITEAIGPASYFGALLADVGSKGKGTDVDKGNIAQLIAKQGIGQQGAAAGFAGIAGALGGNFGEALSVAQNVMGQVANPHLQMLYKGIALREFQFEFRFTPSSSQEAAEVDKIINQFTYWSLPSVTAGSGVSHQYLEPPEMFDISFVFMGGTGVASAVSNFFRNIGTNIFGSQLTSLLSPGQSNISNGNKAKIFQIYHRCVLMSMSVDYAPNGWASFNDGYPVETRLILQFKETDIVTKQDMKGGVGSLGVFGNATQQELQNVEAMNPDTYNTIGELPLGPTLSDVGGTTYTNLANMPGFP